MFVRLLFSIFGGACLCGVLAIADGMYQPKHTIEMAFLLFGCSFMSLFIASFPEL